MSMTDFELNTVLDFQADFDLFLSEKKWKEALDLMDNLGDLGYENEARIMHQTYNRVRAEYFAEIEEKRKNEVMERMHNDFINAIESDEKEDPRDVADRNGY